MRMTYPKSKGACTSEDSSAFRLPGETKRWTAYSRCVVMRAVLVCVVLALCVNAVPDEAIERLLSVKRVIGGTDVEEGEWPWLVHLTGKIPTSWMSWLTRRYINYYCGASVINKRWLMTAAHCLKVPGAPSAISKPKHWHAKIGEIKKSHTPWERIKDRWTQWFGGPASNRQWYVHAERIVIHPGYDRSDKWKNDIALIRVETDLPVGPSDRNIGPVPLPAAGSWPPGGATCVMKGWGCSRNGGPQQDIAKEVMLDSKDNQVCDFKYGTIGPTRVCAGYNLENKGICQGDSGGPLVCKDGNSWRQAGIASFTSSRSPGNTPGVFTRVAFYRTWIDSIVNDV